MSRYPKAIWKPVVGLEKDPPIIPVGVILHVDGGNAGSLYEYFNGPSGGIESHLFLTKKREWTQFRDTEREADANYRGNSWIGADGKRYGFLSVETQGLASGTWSDGMLAEIKEFLTWASNEHGFPLRVAPGYRSPGVGYHIMFGAGEGLNAWSNARGKVCPGPDRIKQFKEIIVPWMKTGEEVDMPLTDADVDKVVKGLLNYRNPDATPDSVYKLLINSADSAAIAKEVWRYNQGGATGQAWGFLQRAAGLDVAELAKEIATALPTSAVTDSQVESALRKVFGSLDSAG